MQLKCLRAVKHGFDTPLVLNQKGQSIRPVGPLVNWEYLTISQQTNDNFIVHDNDRKLFIPSLYFIVARFRFDAVKVCVKPATWCLFDVKLSKMTNYSQLNDEEKMRLIKDAVKSYPDFPVKGVLFR